MIPFGSLGDSMKGATMTVQPQHILTRRGFLAGSAAGASLIALHPYSAYAAANQAHLRIMETTDLHVHVFPYDYYSDKQIDTVGLARTAAIIEAVRAEATNAMLVDNGDFCLLYTSPSPRDKRQSRMPSSA